MKILLLFTLLFLTLSIEVVDFFPPRNRLRPKITHPKFHPFENRDQLEKVQDADPFGFSVDNYKNSLSNLALHHASNDYDSFEEFSDELSYKNIAKKQLTTYKVSGKHFPGTINLDDYESEIISIKCQKKGELTIVTEDLDFLKSILPGSRLHFGFQWSNNNEECKEEFIGSHYVIVDLRKNFVSQTPFELTFEVSDLSFNEMFQDVSIDLDQKEYQPTEEEASNQSIDTKEKLLFFGFNYDEDTQSVEERSIEMYKDDYQKVTCENCYAYLDSGIILKVETSWLKVKQFKIGVYGQTEANFEVKYQFKYGFHKTFKKQLYTHKFHSIKFMVGHIPVYIAPAIELNAQSKIDLDAQLTITSSVKYSKYLEVSLNYDGDKIHTEKVDDPAKVEFVQPKILDSSKGTLHADLEIVPKILLYVYAIAPVQLTATPKVYFDGEITTKKMDYSTSYKVDVHLGLDPLEIPKEIPEIGGKTYDFNGLLPWEKTWEIVPKQKLTCKYCSGEIDF